MPTLSGGGLVNCGQGHSRLNDDHIVKGLDLADRLHPLERQEHLAIGDLSPDKAGIAALRGNGHARLGAQGYDLRDLLRRARQQQQRRIAMPAPAPLNQLGGQSLRILAPPAVANNGLKAGQDGLWNGLAHGPSLAAPRAGGQRVIVFHPPHAEPVEAWAAATIVEPILVLRQAQDEDDWGKAALFFFRFPREGGDPERFDPPKI